MRFTRLSVEPLDDRMTATSVAALQAQTIAAFSFLGEPLESRIVAPDDYRGGFVLDFPLGVRVQYLDCEVTVNINGDELFGPKAHGVFAGNMFSQENLPKSLQRIAEHVRAQVGPVV